jgi:hypothetical protein
MASYSTLGAGLLAILETVWDIGGSAGAESQTDYESQVAVLGATRTKEATDAAKKAAADKAELKAFLEKGGWIIGVVGVAVIGGVIMHKKTRK